jgi:cytochrome c-type biogenesis protein CcmH/NrfG
LSDAALWSALGELHKARGERGEALEAFQKALGLEPKNQWLTEVIDGLS